MSERAEPEDRAVRGLSSGKILAGTILVLGLCAVMLPMRVSNNRKARSARASAMIAAIDQGLENYRTDNGDYPQPQRLPEVTTIHQKAVITGPARTLYQALSGDGNDAIAHWDGIVRNSIPSNGESLTSEKVYWEDIVDPVVPGESTIRKGVPVVKTDQGFVLVDPWGNPWQYEMYDAEVSDEDYQNTINMTYDLWSFGVDKSLGEQPEGESKWITNYGATSRSSLKKLTPWRTRPHPDAIPNTHKSGDVDIPVNVKFIVPNPRRLKGIVLDETSAVLQGDWQYSTHTPPYVGIGYLHDQNSGKGEKSVTWTHLFGKTGKYEVRVSHCYNVRRSTNTPITIRHANGETTVRVNQQEVPEYGQLFRSLGVFEFKKGDSGSVCISNEGTGGKYVIADAVQFIPVD